MALRVEMVGSPGRTHLPTLESLRRIARRREIWVFSGIMGLGLAILDILMSWIEPVLSPVGLGGIAGEATALMIAAGILGASVMGTSGAHNPTLTVQALAWRTAHYLANNWRSVVG
jgi:hypothetical protein